MRVCVFMSLCMSIFLSVCPLHFDLSRCNPIVSFDFITNIMVSSPDPAEVHTNSVESGVSCNIYLILLHLNLYSLFSDILSYCGEEKTYASGI